jgi:threonine synthase
MPGTLNLAASKAVINSIKFAVENDRYIAAICAAPSILGDMGVLQGKNAICYPGFEDRLAGAQISSERVVLDGKILTAAGMGAALDMGSEIVRIFCGDEKAKQTIAKVFKEQGYLCDTHTATAWAVAEDYVNQTGDNAPMVVLSTASPYKFPAAVLSSLEDVPQMDEFQQMERLEAVSGVKIPENLAGLQEKKELHTGVIEKTAMLDFVMGL